MLQILKDLGLHSTNAYTLYRGEYIYCDGYTGKYYPTLAIGYLGATVCDTLHKAIAWIDYKKSKKC